MDNSDAYRLCNRFQVAASSDNVWVSFGKSIAGAKKTVTAIRIVAGIILIAAGFYFLETIRRLEKRL